MTLTLAWTCRKTGRMASTQAEWKDAPDQRTLPSLNGVVQKRGLTARALVPSQGAPAIRPPVSESLPCLGSGAP